MAEKKRTYAKRISLSGFTPEEAITRALNTPLPPNRSGSDKVKENGTQAKPAPKKGKPKK